VGKGKIGFLEEGGLAERDETVRGELLFEASQNYTFWVLTFGYDFILIMTIMENL